LEKGGKMKASKAISNDNNFNFKNYDFDPENILINDKLNEVFGIHSNKFGTSFLEGHF